MSREKYNKIKRQKFQSKILLDKILDKSMPLLSTSPYIDFTFVKNHPEFNWNFKALTKNTSISLDEIISNPRYPWYMANISARDDITVEFLYSHPKIKYDPRMLSVYLRTIVTDVITYPEIEWCWDMISLNENITEKFVYEHRTKPFDQYMLTQNKALSIKFIMNTPSIFSWALDEIVFNPNMTDDILTGMLSMGYRIAWDHISINPGISINFIMAHKQYPWDPIEVSSRQDVTIEVINKNPSYPWDWDCISAYSNIPVFILKEDIRTDMDSLRFNRTHSVDEMVDTCIYGEYNGPIKINDVWMDFYTFEKWYIAVRKIEDWFIQCYWDDQYLFCRKRLEKEYKNLFLTQ